MTTYNVHLYREMRLVFLGVEAASQEEAAHRVFQLPSDAAESFEDCEGRTLGALVDVRGDREHNQSKMFDAEDGRLLDAGPAMLDALQDVAAFLEENYDHNEPAMQRADKARAAIAKATGGAA